MAIDKALLSESTTMLIFKLLEEKDMYGYQMIDELAKKSDNTFNLKAGTLYPLLHGLKQCGVVSAYDDCADSEHVRKYYLLSSKEKRLLTDKQEEWTAYAKAVKKVLSGGECYDAV